MLRYFLYICSMKRLFTSVLFVFLCVYVLFAYPRYRIKLIQDPVPKEMEDIYELDTLLSGYWVIDTCGMVIYPTMVGYRVQPDMSNYVDWPSVKTALDLSKEYFLKHTGALYYEDRHVKVFVSRSK